MRMMMMMMMMMMMLKVGPFLTTCSGMFQIMFEIASLENDVTTCYRVTD